MVAELGFEEIPVILLAAGRGSRAGGPKGLLEFQGRPWIVEQLRRCREVGLKRVIVVLGYQHVDYFAALARHPAPDGLVVDAVVNSLPERGQFSSIQCGVSRACETLSRSAFVLPVDVPCPKREVWQSLVDNLSTSTQACLPQLQGRGGHPVLLNAALLERIGRLDPAAPNARLDALLHELPIGTVRRVTVDDLTVLMNFNSSHDWATQLSKL